MNNLVPVGDYTFVGQLSPYSLLDLVKEISICMMRALFLLNQLSVDREKFILPSILPQEVLLLKT